VRKLVDGADEVIRGLRALQCDERDPWLIFILLSKLDPETRQSWGQRAEPENSSVTIDQFLTFLTSHCDTFEACQLSRAPQARRSAATHHADAHQRRDENKCLQVYCQQTHQLYRCDQFLTLDIAAR